MSTIKLLLWREDGHRSLLTVTLGEHGVEVADEPAPDHLARPPGKAGIAVLEDPDGWLGAGAEPLGSALYAGPGIEALLSEYVARGRIDDRAPTQAEGQVVIDATPQQVWQILADVERWPSIRADVHDVHAAGSPKPGGTFTWSSGANRVRSTFGAVEPGRLLTWVSTSSGATFTHVYRTAPEAPGRTLLTCRESLAGPVVAALIPSAALQAGVDSWLAGIKALAEAH